MPPINYPLPPTGHNLMRLFPPQRPEPLLFLKQGSTCIFVTPNLRPGRQRDHSCARRVGLSSSGWGFAHRKRQRAHIASALACLAFIRGDTPLPPQATQPPHTPPRPVLYTTDLPSTPLHSQPSTLQQLRYHRTSEPEQETNGWGTRWRSYVVLAPWRRLFRPQWTTGRLRHGRHVDPITQM
jgi:hypothetical protein